MGSVSFEVLERVGDIGLRDDCIALKYVASAPAAGLHDDTFRDSGGAQVARGNAAQIVGKQSGNVSCEQNHQSAPRKAEKYIVNLV